MVQEILPKYISKKLNEIKKKSQLDLPIKEIEDSLIHFFIEEADPSFWFLNELDHIFLVSNLIINSENQENKKELIIAALYHDIGIYKPIKYPNQDEIYLLEHFLERRSERKDHHTISGQIFEKITPISDNTLNNEIRKIIETHRIEEGKLYQFDKKSHQLHQPIYGIEKSRQIFNMFYNSPSLDLTIKIQDFYNNLLNLFLNPNPTEKNYSYLPQEMKEQVYDTFFKFLKQYERILNRNDLSEKVKNYV